MKKIHALIVGLIFLLAAGCSKEKDPQPEANTPANSTTAPACRITSWHWLNDPSQNYSSQFEYDSQQRLTRVNVYKETSLNFVRNFSYNAAGAISEITVSHAATNAVMERMVYAYNAAGQLSKRTYYADNFAGQFLLQRWDVYKYNAANKLAEIYSHYPPLPDSVSGYSVVTYPAPNQVTLQNYAIVNGRTVKGYRVENTYDNQPNPSPYRFIFYTDNLELLSQNNLLLTKETTFTNGGSDSATNITALTYQYDANGLPTEVYRSYNGSAALPWESFGYSCE